MYHSNRHFYVNSWGCFWSPACKASALPTETSTQPSPLSFRMVLNGVHPCQGPINLEDMYLSHLALATLTS